MGRSRYQILNEQYPYFHTSTVVGWQPVFTRQESVQIVLDRFVWLQEQLGNESQNFTRQNLKTIIHFTYPPSPCLISKPLE